MKKTLMTLALLCTLVQGAWVEDVNYIYYTVNSDGKTITKHTDATLTIYAQSETEGTMGKIVAQIK